ncbi:MAG: sensor histidine kinase, partial [Candidatus Methylomirabilales bacterium]
GVGYYSIRRLTVVNHQLEEINKAWEMTSALNLAVAQISTPPRQYLIFADAWAKGDFEEQVRRVEEKLVSCGSAVCHGAPKRPSEMADEIVPAIRTLEEKARLILQLRDPVGDPRGLELMREVDGMTSKVADEIGDMWSALLERVQKLQGESNTLSRRAAFFLLALTFSVAPLAVFVAYVTSRRISDPIRQLLFGTKRIAEGDLEYRVKGGGADEIVELTASFNAMVGELKRYRVQLEDYSRTLEERVRQRTEELRKKDEQLLQSEKLASLGLLASGVAHELNNPLTSILMTTNLILEDLPPGSELGRELGKVNTDASRVKRIIDDLRAFARRHELRKTLCDLNALVEKTLGLVRHELALGEIRVAQDFADGLPSIICDPDRIQQVLMNVIINAIQAMEGGGTLTVKTGVREGKRVEITVRDTGPGILQEVRPRIFDPFFTTKKDGTGLGLSISYGIVQDHGGGIEVESVTGREREAGGGPPGTTVKILLPIEGDRP